MAKSHERKFGRYGNVYYHIDTETTKGKALARVRALREHGYLARYTKSAGGYDIWRTSKSPY